MAANEEVAREIHFPSCALLDVAVVVFLNSQFFSGIRLLPVVRSKLDDYPPLLVLENSRIAFVDKIGIEDNNNNKIRFRVFCKFCYSLVKTKKTTHGNIPDMSIVTNYTSKNTRKTRNQLNENSETTTIITVLPGCTKTDYQPQGR